jgi:hypothetical protein
VDGTVTKRNNFEPKVITEALPFDYGAVFNVPLEQAVQYLNALVQTHVDKTLYLDEHWAGYEDMEIRLMHQRLETDEEMEARIEAEHLKDLSDEELRVSKLRRKNIEKQIRHLQRQL